MATAVRRRSLSPPSSRRWSCSPPATVSSPYFPPDLIPEVARRLTNLQDFFALRAACRAYRAALPVTPSNLASQAPLLLLLLNPFFGETEPLALFHLPLGRFLRFRRPLTHGSLLSLGCRVVIWDYPSRSEVRIVHLLTGDQTRLPCPSNDFSSVVLSGSLVLTWSFLGRTIQYCHLEAADWRVAAISEPYLLEALICVNGTIYALVTPCSASENRSVYRLAVVNLSDNNNFAELVFIGGALDAQTLHSPDGMHLCLHPAECRGELLLISAVDFHPLVFHIFQWKSGEAKWVRITSLGGCALFFSNVRFVGCLGPDHPGIRKDCMYFNDGDLWHEYTSVDGSFRRSDTAHPGVKLEKDFMLAGWVFPSMC